MSIWNEDGTPKRPEPNQGAEHAFADLGINTGTSEGQQLFLSYARVRAQALANQPPAVGDVVHAWVDGECLAAMVTKTEIFEDEIWISVFMPGERTLQPIREVAHDEGKAEGAPSWHWPESE